MFGIRAGVLGGLAMSGQGNNISDCKETSCVAPPPVRRTLNVDCGRGPDRLESANMGYLAVLWEREREN